MKGTTRREGDNQRAHLQGCQHPGPLHWGLFRPWSKVGLSKINQSWNLQSFHVSIDHDQVKINNATAYHVNATAHRVYVSYSNKLSNPHIWKLSSKIFTQGWFYVINVYQIFCMSSVFHDVLKNWNEKCIRKF